MDFTIIEDESLRTKLETEYNSEVAALKVEFESSVEPRINEATTRLKTKADELLAEKKKLQERYKNIPDPVAAFEALQLVQNNSDVQLVKDGKLEEVIERRVSAVRSDYDAKFEEITAELGKAQSYGHEYEQLYKNKMVEDAIREAAIDAKVLPSSIKYIVMDGIQIFSLNPDDNKTIEARTSDGKLRRTEDNSKIMTPALFVEQLKRSAPHFWPPSESAHFQKKGRSTEIEDLEEEANAASASGDTKRYRELRANIKALKAGRKIT